MKPSMWASRTVDGYPLLAGKAMVIKDYCAVLSKIWREFVDPAHGDTRLVKLALKASVQLEVILKEQKLVTKFPSAVGKFF